MTKTIVITSGKGGVGKTNISVNIAVELARRQYRTCLFDADLGLANVNILLGIHPEKTIDDLLFQGASLEQIVAPTEHGVDIIPGSSGIEQMANLDSGQLAGLVESFEALADYDYFLLDTSSGISRGVISFCLAAAETLLVLTAEATSLADAYAVLKVLSLNNYQGTVKVLVNKCVSIPQAKKTYLHFKSVADKHLNIEVAPGGAVLFDPLITKAVTLQYPAVALYPESIFSQCIRALVANLVRTESQPEAEGGFWSRYADFVQADLLLPGEPGRVSSSPKGSRPRHDHHAGQEPLQMTEGSARRSGTAGDPAALQQYAGVFTSGRLPGPLSLYSLLLAKESSGDLTTAEMQEFVRHDPACLGRVLQLHAAHSTAGPSSNRTTGIERMVADLGEETVRKVLVGTACHGLLQADSMSEHLAVNDLWSHSCRCGLMSESLAGLIDYPFPEEIFIGGMLHDIGRLALQSRFPELYGDGPLPHDHREGTAGAERTVAGVSHAELGAEMLAGWGVGSFMVDAARYHGEPAERIVTALDMTRLVCLAHMLCSPEEEQVAQAVDLAWQLFRLSSAQVFTSMQEVSQQLARLAAAYGILRRQDHEETVARESLRAYRLQAAEFATLQTILPSPVRAGALRDEVRAICQGLLLLYGCERTICLFPDSRRRQLRAEGYPQCYGAAFVANISFSLASRESRIVEAYRSLEGVRLAADTLHSMADRQLLRLMQAEELLCLPLCAGERAVGLVVCGMDVLESRYIATHQKKMALFASRAAARLVAL